MKKLEILNALHKAKSAHLRWTMYAHGLIKGLPLEKEQVPINGADCDFAKWYYGEGQILHPLANFRALEEAHLKVHQVYLDIFVLLFAQDKKTTLWDHFIGKSKKNQEKNQAEAEALFMELEKYSRELIGHLDALQGQLEKMPEEAFAKLG